MSKQLNGDAIVQRFRFYMQESNIRNAVEMLLDDCTSDSDELSEGQVGEQLDFVIEEIVIPSILCKFADHYTDISRFYDTDPDPNSVWETFCTFENIADSNLANAVAIAINEAAAADDVDDDTKADWDTPDWGNVTADDADDVDDNNIVFSHHDCKNLSAEQRQQKVKNFLRKIAHVGNDAKTLKPFIKDFNVGKDPYGIDNRGRKYKTFDRAVHRFGHPPAPTTYKESIAFPNSSGQEHDPFHKGHELQNNTKVWICVQSHYTNSLSQWRSDPPSHMEPSNRAQGGEL